MTSTKHSISSNISASHQSLTTFTSSLSQRALSISGGNGPVLTIYSDGSVEWLGPPSHAANTLIKSIRGNIDLSIAGTDAIERSYRRAISKCLNMAKSMNRDTFIAMLEEELQTRTSKAVIMDLSKED